MTTRCRLAVGVLSSVGLSAAIVTLSATPATQAPASGASCEALASLALPHARITAAERVAAGAFSAPGAAQQSAAFKQLPAFCRVAATLTPSRRFAHRDGAVAAGGKLERQVPRRRQRRLGRQHRARRDGSGSAPRLRGRIQRHRPSGCGRGVRADIREKLVDFGYRAMHEMTVQSKAIIASFYNRAPAAVLLPGLLDRRPPGHDGSAALSRRLRRDHRRSAGLQPWCT